ncbi:MULTISPECIES: alpha/beta hydrolase [Rhodanobacteraceae]|uniref:alpha/beta hydrolase n=1 Tax=Rhodanobacteraceae TaxID=1775411 RepID=UPI00088625EB|nr:MULTISPECIES: alpha/beta hydrolase [Rhodanobacteraceae]SDF93861.1 Acetyl esterase/lipase [Dyella sp. 333MFSha]SKB94580.1 Acetyl esterase/lipase [Luteibacter sp. 22Crub2.1]
MSLRAFILLFVVLLGGCKSAFFGAMNARQSTDGVVAHRDLVYDRALNIALDVYAPAQATHAPVVVYFYGGSWMSGKRQWFRWVGEALAARGIVTIVADVRLWPAARQDGFLHDGAEAVRWAHDHAGEFGGDPHDEFVMGHSSGGQVAAMLAVDKQWLGAVGMRPRDLAGFIGVAGTYDFIPFDEPEFADIFGHTPAEQARSQPINFVDGDEPPALLLQGEKDTIVSPAEAVAFEGRYRQQGEPVELKLYPAVGHEGLLLALGPRQRSASVLADTVDFIRRHPAAH